MRFTNVSAACALLLAAPLMAQENSTEQATADNPLSAAISENLYPIALDPDGALSGAGHTLLMEQANAAQFVLIGEKHATADIAHFASALHTGLAQRGYNHFVAEIGPWSTRRAEALIRSGEGALAEFIGTPGNQFTLPFLFFNEEIAYVENIVALSPHSQEVLWGVDQEFLGAGPILAPVLDDAAETPAQQSAIAALRQGVASNPMYLGTAPEAEINALVAAFKDAPGAGAKIVRDIALTHEVYGPFTRGTGPIYPANLLRENYMKDNFLRHFEAAEARLGSSPKAVFKFGGYHLERGLSGTNVPSLGNFVMEWGRSRGFTALHVMLDCVGGEAYDIMAGGPTPCKSYSLGEDSPILEALPEDKFVLLDLRALRPLLTRKAAIDDKTRDLILSYDFYIPIRDVKPATPAADLTLPGM